jgi:hypothetical protein
MYRNILALLPTESSLRPVVDGSISLAVACGAELEALAVGFDVTTMPLEHDVFKRKHNLSF